MRKESQDDQNIQGLNSGINLQSRLDKIGSRSQKMYKKIDEVFFKAIQAIQQSQKSIVQLQSDSSNALQKLHVKMTQIKPLKTIKDQYNDFYKKLSGFGKTIQQPQPKPLQKIQTPQLFNQKDIECIQQSLSDHYLSKHNYEAANSIKQNNYKEHLFQECLKIKQEILQGKFDRAAKWVHEAGLQGDQGRVAYQIQKMKVIKLVRDDKADQAVTYLRQNLANYASQNGNQISKLMNFIITQSNKFWGAESQYSEVFKDRYNSFITIKLEQLASKFTQIYLKTNKLYLINPISKCYQVGLQHKQQFMDHLKYMPQGKQLPKVLPFSIKSKPENKYHSQFFCPVTKQIHGSLDKNIVLSCGHMVSNSAMSKLMEGRDSRRKTKCPICQSDQIFQQHLKVQF